MKILMVGQAPGAFDDPEHYRPLTGPSGQRMADLVGLSVDEFVGLFDVTNVLERWPGRAARGGGDAFPIIEAKRRAAKILLDRPNERVVLVGKRTAEAFGVYADTDDMFQWFDLGDRRMVVLPHPSGRSRWWNGETNRRKARDFLLKLVGMARDGGGE